MPQLQGYGNYLMLVLFIKPQILIWSEFEKTDQLGFELGSPGPKAAMLTIELHSKKNQLSHILPVLDSI